jgi:hypothetical protein
MTCKRMTLLTQHGKESILGPVFEADTDYKLELVSGFDTDLLGTFGRDVPRAGSQLEAARRKCRLGMELGISLAGVASEGAFVMDPFAGLIPWNIEVVVFMDDEAQLEVVGMAQGAAQNSQQLMSDVSSLADFAVESNFPSHHLMLRSNNEDDSRIWKGLADWDSLRDAFRHAQELSSSGLVFVESDLRAFCNPTRQKMIRSAAENLAHKLASICPCCGAAGFWITSHVTGLRCRQCLAATRVPMAEVWSCAKCTHREERVRLKDAFADPSKCDNCNP